MENLVAIKNTSDKTLPFTGHAPFKPNEQRDVTKAEAEFLSHNPDMEIVKKEGDAKTASGSKDAAPGKSPKK